jgi:hypothetical protein
MLGRFLTKFVWIPASVIATLLSDSYLVIISVFASALLFVCTHPLFPLRICSFWKPS